ncbi:MAG: phosphoribosylamine--glycine ligase [Candidatus Heimdallarchaeota archaeon]
MNRILLVGNGAREHTIAKALKYNENVELMAYMNRINPGIKSLAKEIHIGNLNSNESIVDFAKKTKADLAVIGPENPLANGIVDELMKDADIPSASPDKAMSKLEWSKAYCRQILFDNSIPANPEFHIFTDRDDQNEIVREMNRLMKDWNNQVAVKPDYLTGGKGVKVWGDHFSDRDQVLDYIGDVLSKGNHKVIVEKKLQKPSQLVNSEFTLQAFVSGENLLGMPLVQDFKRAYDGDKGPNTGSMGSYSCKDLLLPFLSSNDYEFALEVMKSAVRAIGGYRGFLYGQFMLTTEGVKLIEFNSRLGDPEAINVLPLFLEDFTQSCYKLVQGVLPKDHWQKKATVCVYLTPKGYPINPVEGMKVKIDVPQIQEMNGGIYYASVKEEATNTVSTTSSRALGILGIGDSVSEARNIAYSCIGHVRGDLHYRTDIAGGIK